MWLSLEIIPKPSECLTRPKRPKRPNKDKKGQKRFSYRGKKNKHFSKSGRKIPFPVPGQEIDFSSRSLKFFFGLFFGLFC